MIITYRIFFRRLVQTMDDICSAALGIVDRLSNILTRTFGSSSGTSGKDGNFWSATARGHVWADAAMMTRALGICCLG